MLKKIFEPIKIGSMTLENRLVVPAMASNYSNIEGNATEQLIAYHEAKAKGKWGLIITEDYRISPEAGASAALPGLYNDSQIEGHKKLTDRVHAVGGKIVAQIYHAGWESKRSFTGECPFSVTAVKKQSMAEMPEALSVEKIQKIIQQFADCAVRAQKAGFDGVEIHGAHGYLLEQFFSPQMNFRIDEYGGDFAGRAKLALDVVKAVRAAVGKDYPIIYRMTVAEYVEGGLGIEESKALAILLEEAGVNAIHCSQGASSMGNGMMTIAPTAVRPASYVGHAAAIKSVVDVPVIAVGRINTPEIAEAVVRSGQADLVAMGRASIADPELPLKAQKGELKAINHCIGCVQGCIGEKRRGNALSCMVNPSVGHESEWKLEKTDKVKKIYIAGGGVAGCETAIVAAMRGHDVTVFEKDSHLGGQWYLAAIPVGKSEFASFVKWQKYQMEQLGVKIQLSTELTADLIVAEQPDIVVNATGSVPAIVPIKGVEHSHVTTAHKVLAGGYVAGKNVVIIGGGLVGAETAEFLAYNGSQVTILEAQSKIAKDGEAASNQFMMENLQKHHVAIYTDAKVIQINENNVYFQVQEQEYVLDNVDTVIMATGVKSNQEFATSLQEKDILFVSVGDAAKVKNGFHNIQEGYKLGMKL